MLRPSPCTCAQTKEVSNADIYDESGSLIGSAAAVPTTQTERFELPKGYYLRRSSDPFSKLWGAVHKERTHSPSDFTHYQAARFAAAMQPAAAAPSNGGTAS